MKDRIVNKLVGLLVAVSVAAITFSMMPPSLLVAQAPPPIVVSASAVAEFTHDGKDEAGAAVTLQDAEFALTGTGIVSLNTGGAVLRSLRAMAVVGPNTVPLAGLFTGMANGTYKVWVRVSAGGLWSQYTASVTVTLSNARPSVPTGFKVRTNP